MEIKVTPFGAAKTVTGSCHLLEVNDLKVLIDCGMFQGENEEKNYEPFPFNPSEIDYLIVTHAHIDHVGRIPLLVKNGFKGRIIATKPTRELTQLMLLDSAKVMKEEYEQALKEGKEAKPPLYDEDDVYTAMLRFNVIAEYHKPLYLSKDVKVLFRNAGHILGSAFVEFYIGNNPVRKIVFSGDLGRREKLIIQPLEFEDSADYVFTESTYGNRDHKRLKETIKEFKNAVIETLKGGGNVVIPTFALERAQEILYILRNMYKRGELPSEVQVFLDSPLAGAITRLFKQFPEYFNEATKKLIYRGENPFWFPQVRFTQTVEESMKINEVRKGAIILAGSGMATGGRVLHHLKHNLGRKECSVIFVGYQVKGTLGRKLIDGAKEVEIFGKRIKVKARIYTINGLSSHAGKSLLLKWISNVKNLKRVFIVHGEPPVMKVFREELIQKGINAHIPDYGEEIVLR
jgi:metallo-beta-lactamase family protein